MNVASKYTFSNKSMTFDMMKLAKPKVTWAM